MTLEEIKLKLGDDKDGIGAAIEELLTAESTRFAQNKSKVNKEAESLRTRLKKTLDVIGYESGDIDEFLENYKSKSENTNNQASSLEKMVAKLQKEMEQERNEKNAIKIKNRNRTIELALKDALKDMPAANFVIKALLADNMVDLDPDENVIFKMSGDVLDLQTGVQKFLAENKHLVTTTTKGGAGAGAGKPAVEKVISREEFDKLPAQEKMAKAKEGFKIT